MLSGYTWEANSAMSSSFVTYSQLKRTRVMSFKSNAIGTFQYGWIHCDNLCLTFLQGWLKSIHKYLASSKSYCVYNTKVYEGKGTRKGPNGLGYKVCTEFFQNVYCQSHVLIFDHLPPWLSDNLMVDRTWNCNITRPNPLCFLYNLHQKMDNKTQKRLIICVHGDHQMACLN